MKLPSALELDDEVLEIVRQLEAAGHETWCVGGAIRDRLIGAPSANDEVDLATAARPEQVQALFRRTIGVGIAHGTVGVLDRQRRLREVTTFRRDVETDGRHAVVQYGVSIDEDLARRDFTINAIAYHPLRREWRDPYSGADDLERKVVRAVGEAAQRFREDYLRILRALRFAARFGFLIDPATWDAARSTIDGIAQLSAERVRDEWFKGLATAVSPVALAELWRDVGASRGWVPELLDSRELRGRWIESTRDPVILTAWLTSDPAAVLRRLKASNAEIARAAAMAAGPSAPRGEDDPSIRRWLARVGAEADDLMALATLRDGDAPSWVGRVSEVRRRGDPIARGDLAINGSDLAQLGLSGPRMGSAINRLLERVHDDPRLNDRETLLRLAREEG